MVLLVLLSACGAGGRYIVLGTAKAPSTSGVIEVDGIDGGSTLVTVHMEHLHPPERIDRGFKSYVVWFQGKSGSPIRAGKLSYDADSRTGDLAGTSPLRQFMVTITAEREDTSSRPSDFVIASQQVELD